MPSEIILWIAFGGWLVFTLIYLIGLLARNPGLREAGIAGVAGILIGMICFVIIAIFELGIIGLAVFALSALILIPMFRGSGIGAIYAIGIAMVIIGYFFAGPYSGYVKSLVSGTSAPIDLAINQLYNMGYDLFLLATDPQAYVNRQMMSNVKTESSSVGYPKGVEFKKLTISPSTTPPDGEFYVEVYVKNEGQMGANVILSASCNSKLCCIGDSCGNSESTTFYYPAKDTPSKLERYEAMIERIGPFKVAKATSLKKSDLGKNAEVNVTVHYAHSTSSSLMVSVMSQDEIRRQITDPVLGEQLYRTVTPTGKNAPGMVAITVGYQPLSANKRIPMAISVVNKRPKGNVVLGKDAVLQIMMPAKIGSELSCSAPGVVCTSNGQTATCRTNRDISISPIDKLYAVMCSFITPESVETQVSDAVTANLSGYTFEETQKVGTRIMSGFEPVGTTYQTTDGDGGAGYSEVGTGGNGITTTTYSGGGGGGTTETTIQDVECNQQCINAGYSAGSGTSSSSMCINYPRCSGTTCQYGCSLITNQQGYSPYCYCYIEDNSAGWCDVQRNCGSSGFVPYTTTTMSGSVATCCAGEYEVIIGAYDTSSPDYRCTDYSGKGCVNGLQNCNVADCRTYGDTYSCFSSIHKCFDPMTSNTVDPSSCTKDSNTNTYIGSGCGSLEGVSW